MRVLLIALIILCLQGCIATQKLQQESIALTQQLSEQCSTHSQQLEQLLQQQEKTNQLVRREARAREEMIPLIRGDQSCDELRKSLNNKTVVGAVEWAWVDFGSFQRAAKVRMDTGASTSSISASDITEFERNGKRWVRFKLEDGQEVSVVVERFANIRQASSDSDKRWVIKLGIRLGNIAQIAEFTLKDRRHLRYEVLVGRNLLRDLMVVDVARRYVLGKKPQGGDN